MVAPSAGGSRLPWQRTPTTNPFFTNSKKSDGRNMLQTHINTVEARTFPTVHAATQSPVEAEPLRSKDRGFFSYNIDVISINSITCNSAVPELFKLITFTFIYIVAINIKILCCPNITHAILLKNCINIFNPA